ncbi:hypothetical protein B0H14DRAFT_3470217 [Mycena olivaceomarginata]|nr:hypothetical protein B0H14DRAFT_3470217 [Mycena olivaceomarginata]
MTTSRHSPICPMQPESLARPESCTLCTLCWWLQSAPGPLHPPEDLLTRSHALHFARVWMQAKKKRGATNGTPALLATTPHDADTSPHCPGIASCKQNRQRAHVPPSCPPALPLFNGASAALPPCW